MPSFALHGIGVSGGIAIGRAQLVSHATLEVAHYTIPANRVEAEITRLDNALDESMDASDPPSSTQPVHRNDPLPSSGYDAEAEKKRSGRH